VNDAVVDLIGRIIEVHGEIRDDSIDDIAIADDCPLEQGERKADPPDQLQVILGEEQCLIEPGEHCMGCGRIPFGARIARVIFIHVFFPEKEQFPEIHDRPEDERLVAAIDVRRRSAGTTDLAG